MDDPIDLDGVPDITAAGSSDVVDVILEQGDVASQPLQEIDEDELDRPSNETLFLSQVC